MNFIDHTLIWSRGEMFEMGCLAFAGGVLLTVAWALWRLAPTPIGQALPIPLTIAAIIFLIAGLVGMLTTPDKQAGFISVFNQDPVAFVYAEKIRVAAFEKLYTYTMIGVAVSFSVAVTLFALSVNAMPRAIAVTLVFVGLSGLVIDMFSKERATVYAAVIEQEIKQINSNKVAQ